MSDIEEFGKKLTPEIRPSVMYCSTLTIVLGLGEKLFVSNGKISPPIFSLLLKANM